MHAPRSLTAAVVGLGVGEQHARAYQTLAGCRLKWLYDIDAERTADVIRRTGGGRPARDYAAIVQDPEVDIISIASFDDAHFEQARMALTAGKHVFVEKPLCRTALELAELRAAWQSAGMPHIWSNLVLRRAPLYVWLKAAIAAGELGDIYSFDGEYLYGRLEKITHGWRAGVRDYSVMLGGGVHLVDLMLWLTGQRPLRVWARSNRVCTRETAFEYDDFTAATFMFPGDEYGMIGRIVANFGCVHRHHHVVRVFGTKATVVCDDLGARLYGSRDPAASPKPLSFPGRPATKGDLIPDFVAAIQAGVPSPSTAAHEFDVISACLAADRAARHQSIEDIVYA